MIIWHSSGAFPRPEVLLFTRIKLHRLYGQIWGTCSKRLPRVSVHQLLWYRWPCLLRHQLQLWGP